MTACIIRQLRRRGILPEHPQADFKHVVCMALDADVLGTTESYEPTSPFGAFNDSPLGNVPAARHRPTSQLHATGVRSVAR
jgi:hypothetical protein